MHYADFIKKIKPSASMAMGLNEDISTYTNFAIGVPDISPPPELIDLIKQVAGSGHYPYVPSKGSLKARKNAVNILFPNEHVNPETEISLVNGAKYGVFLSLKTICNPGEGIVLMEPYWLSYPEICHTLNLKIKTWKPQVIDNQCIYSISKLKEIVEADAIKVVVLNNPNNPTGQVFNKEFVMKLSDYLESEGIVLLIDEVYKSLVYKNVKSNSFTLNNNHTVLIGSFSKSMCIPGLRIGYIKGNTEFIKNADLINQHLQTCINSIANSVIEHVSPKLYDRFTSHSANVYAERVSCVEKLINERSKLNLMVCEASFYGFMDFSAYFDSGDKAAKYLFDNLNVIATPGKPYGDNFEKYVRFCFTLPLEKLMVTFDDIINKLETL